MVGNFEEWVADWVPRAGQCGNWLGTTSLVGYANDTQCMDRVTTTSPIPGGPGALIRGGSYNSGDRAGVFSVTAEVSPVQFGMSLGFRCAR